MNKQRLFRIFTKQNDAIKKAFGSYLCEPRVQYKVARENSMIVWNYVSNISGAVRRNTYEK